MFKFIYSIENEKCSNRTESWYMNQKRMDVSVSVALKCKKIIYN